MAFHEPLELQYWFVQVLTGNWDIFSVVAIFLLSTLAAKLRLPMGTFLVFLIVFAGVLLSAGQNGLMVLAILIVGPVFFWITRRLTE